MHLIITFLISVLILLIILIISHKFKLFLDEPIKNVRKIHNKVVIKIGGISMLSFYFATFYVDDPILLEIIFFSFFFMIIGLVADLNNKFGGSIRFILMTLILLIFLLRNNFILDNLDHNVLNNIFNSYEFLPYIFTVVGLLFCINGFNFIDGNDGLMSGITIIILINFYIYAENLNLETLYVIEILLLSVFILFFINITTGKILAGDCGAYFLGFIIGSLSIYIANNELIYATLIACIICYPVNDLFISFWRRLLINKKNPLNPDDKHLHSILFRILKKSFEKNEIKEKLISLNPNSLTSILILAYLSLISFFIYLFGEGIGYLNTFFIISVSQLLIYLFLIWFEQSYSTK